MKYFRDKSNQVFGFDETDSTQQPMIAAAISAKLVDVTGNWPPAPSSAELAISTRADRDGRLAATQWLVDRHTDQSAAGMQTTLTAPQYTTLQQYRQALRDVPGQKGFPESITWPVAPDFMRGAS